MKLFPEDEIAAEGGTNIGSFRQAVARRRVDWQIFEKLDERDKQGALALLLQEGILSDKQEGSYDVILADSCSPEFSLPLVDGRKVYFSRKQDADAYHTYLFSRGCHAIRKKK